MEQKKIGIYLADINHLHGIAEVERCLATGLARRAKALLQEHNIRLTFILPKDKVGYYGPDVDYLVVNNIVKTLVNIDFLGIARKMFFPHFDLLHITHQTPKFHRTLGDKTLVTIHDVNFLHNHNSSRQSMKRKAGRIKRILGIATHLSFVSYFSEQDVKEHFTISQPCRVVVNGTKDWSAVDRKPVSNLPQQFYFHISNLGEKKNAWLLAEMMRFLPDDNLVIAGSGSESDKRLITDVIEKYHLDNVKLIGKVTDEEKAYLLDKCEAFLFPSRSEGFGLPVLEAMCFGKPTIISRLTSLPEIGGDIAYYYDELTAEAMARTTTASIDDFKRDEDNKTLLSRQHALSFSWDNAIDNYVHYYIDIINGKDVPC